MIPQVRRRRLEVVVLYMEGNEDYVTPEALEDVIRGQGVLGVNVEHIHTTVASERVGTE